VIQQGRCWVVATFEFLHRTERGSWQDVELCPNESVVFESAVLLRQSSSETRQITASACFEKGRSIFDAVDAAIAGLHLTIQQSRHRKSVGDKDVVLCGRHVLRLADNMRWSTVGSANGKRPETF
jgi:hypothetical protein